MLWIASKEGTGWSTLRTRDVIDVSFYVTRETDDEHAMITVRCAWQQNENAIGDKARARRKIARMYMPNHQAAKQAVQECLDSINASHPATRDASRTEFLNTLMAKSLPHSKMYPSVQSMYQFQSGVVTYSDCMSSSHVGIVTPSEMMETVKETMETVAEVIDISSYSPGDPPPNGYIWIGKTLTKLGWPS